MAAVNCNSCNCHLYQHVLVSETRQVQMLPEYLVEKICFCVYKGLKMSLYEKDVHEYIVGKLVAILLHKYVHHLVKQTSIESSGRYYLR